MTDLILAPPAMAFITSALLICVLLRFPGLLEDRPNERSLHVRPTPRTGGIAIVVGSLGAWTAFEISDYGLTLAAAAMAIVSILDDWKGLPPLPRFSAHVLIAAGFVFFSLGSPTFWESLFLVLAIVWITNLYNFMDGADGLAAGMTIIGFGFFTALGWTAGQPSFALICASVGAATLPFLAANFHPARLFMGDSGSITLGFLAAAIGTLGWREGLWSPFFPIFVFAPFIADASLTLLRRILRGEAFWRPHRTHYFQKLIRMGFGHRTTALSEYGIMLLSGSIGLVASKLDFEAQLAAILAWGFCLILLASWIDRRWERNLQSTAP